MKYVFGLMTVLFISSFAQASEDVVPLSCETATNFSVTAGKATTMSTTTKGYGSAASDGAFLGETAVDPMLPPKGSSTTVQ